MKVFLSKNSIACLICISTLVGANNVYAHDYEVTVTKKEEK